MMSKNIVETVMRSIAEELGRPWSSFEGFVTKLQENWIDSEETLLMLDEPSVQQLGFPIAVQKKLLAKIADLKGASKGPSPNPGGKTPKPQGDTGQMSSGSGNKMDEEKPTISRDSISQKAQDTLNQIYRDVLGSENFLNVLKMLHTFLGNVISDPKEPKFRTIKLSKPAIANVLGSSKFCTELLSLAGFSGSANGDLELRGQASTQTLTTIIKEIEIYGDKIMQVKQNLGKAGYSSTSGKTNADIASMNHSDISSTYDMVMKLKAQREAELPLTVPRRTRWTDESTVTQERTQKLAQAGLAESLLPEEEMSLDNNKLSLQQTKELLERLTEGPSFTNLRKKELERLKTTPNFTDVIIRFRFPDGRVMESHFSPLEKVRDLRQEVEQNFNPGKTWYLYTSPPVQRLELKRLANNTLQELGMLPAANVYVGFEEAN